MSTAILDEERSVVQTEPRADAVSGEDAPLISVVVLNYNGAKWLERCLASLRQQTILARIEVIVADNLSADGSDRLAEQLLEGWPNGRFVQNGANLGFCEGNNRGAAGATGKFLLFLNNDAWLEPDCLEILLRETEKANADVATPLVMNFDDDSFQSLGAAGFDIFGLPTSRLPHTDTREVLMPEGCAYMIRRELFDRVGRFDAEFFMFADEYDLSWRAWVAGGRAVAVPAARLHHRGAANVNPKGGGTVVEFRTSDSKRFYTNRNSLLVLLKSARHVLLLLRRAAGRAAGGGIRGGAVSGAALEFRAPLVFWRAGGLLAASPSRPGRAPAHPGLSPPGRLMDAVLFSLAAEPVGRTAAHPPVRRAPGDEGLKGVTALFARRGPLLASSIPAPVEIV